MHLYLFLFLSLFPNIDSSNSKQYIKNYYENGTLKSEGWLTNNYKTDYWYFYDKNANLKKEGHFVKGSAENWWIFYEIGSPYKSKIQFKNNKKNGYALCYKNNELIRAEKYKNDLKIGTWTSLLAFKIDNPDVSF